ncbi:MAG TPA: hypothetical protein PLS26_04360, partial [Bacteroidales bacterium]|nr:hypothetical protein [Bacteroidales bacterium]
AALPYPADLGHICPTLTEPSFFGRSIFHQHEAVSKLPLLKIIITPSLKGVLIFSDFHPLGRGKRRR